MKKTSRFCVALGAASLIITACGSTPPTATQPATPSVSARIATSSPEATRIAAPAATTSPTVPPTPAPSAQLIAFAGTDDAGATEVWVMNDDGSDRRQVTETAEDRVAIPSAWSPDGTQIAFAIGPPASELYASGIVNVDGTGQREVADGIGLQWSPDGSQAVFSDASFTAPQLHLMDLPDGEPLTLTQAAGGTWSPDGNLIAYNTQPEQDIQRVAVIAPDGTGLREITPGYGPSWSPDGAQLAYFIGTESGAFEVHVINLDGTGDRLVSEGQVPVWSPDGERIAFVRTDPAVGAIELWVAPADGASEPVQLPVGDYDFSWSPDGSQIAVGADADGDGVSEIHVVGIDGRSDVVIGAGDAPLWQPGHDRD